MSKKIKILIMGATGFVGKEIGEYLAKANAGKESDNQYRISIVTRQPAISATGLPFPATIYTYESESRIPAAALKEVAVIINLAGASIADGRWTDKRKKIIIESRRQTSQSLVEAVNATPSIHTVIQASAIGYYGDTNKQEQFSSTTNEEVDESSPKGKGFLAETTALWEKQLSGINRPVRCITMRLGVVLGSTGGAIKEILTPYILGIGAQIGFRKIDFSWIHVKDVCQFVAKAIEDDSFSGVYNITSPHATTYSELHRLLCKKLGGLPFLKIPEVALQVILGKKAELVLTSQKISPRKLIDAEFQFKYKTINEAIEEIIPDSSVEQTDKPFLGLDYLHRKQWVKADIDKTWEFFSSAGNLEKITPDSLGFKIKKMSTDTIQSGTKIDYALKLHGVPISWRSLILDFNPKKFFRDLQLKGPYKYWDHHHKFTPLDGGTLIEDKIFFSLPLYPLGNIAALFFVRQDLKKIFDYRKHITEKLLCKD